MRPIDGVRCKFEPAGVSDIKNFDGQAYRSADMVPPLPGKLSLDDMTKPLRVIAPR